MTPVYHRTEPKDTLDLSFQSNQSFNGLISSPVAVHINTSSINELFDPLPQENGLFYPSPQENDPFYSSSLFSTQENGPLYPSSPFSMQENGPFSSTPQGNNKHLDVPQVPDEVKVLNFKTIAPQSSQIRIPSSMDDVQQCIVDALSLILPIDAKITIFGFNYSVILVGVLYRHDNLSWIMLNRANMKLYIVCHFVSDGIHLFESVRSKLNHPLRQTGKIWNRQGVPEILLLFESFSDLKNNNAFRINQLPKEILKYNRNQHSFQKAVEFLRGVGSGGMFLQRYIRRQALPYGYSPIIHGLTEGTRGWKVFNPSRSMSGKCFGGKRQTCCVDFVKALEEESFEKLEDFEQAVLISTILPTRMDDPKNKALCLHYQPFIENIRNETYNHSYFPSADFYQEK